MIAPRLLDTNPLLRYLSRDDEAKARRALALLLRVERGEEVVVATPMVIFETVFTLQSFYRMPRADIRDRVGAIIRMRGLQLAQKRTYGRALDLYASHTFLSFADAFNAAFMHDRGITELYTWDEDFDRLTDITRREPGDSPA
jgi:predicted nucleic acid-binding protein